MPKITSKPTEPVDVSGYRKEQESKIAQWIKDLEKLMIRPLTVKHRCDLVGALVGMSPWERDTILQVIVYGLNK